MNDKTIPPDKGGPSKRDSSPKKADRKSRLAEQLRANLQKRKAQSRSRRTGDADKRRTGDADKRPDGLGVLGETQKD
ncbi:hypothetical protein [Mesorhizobium sp.]|uniref:hypothetical protein n=1 Tax=Mesorhizobium sp. TaxID=1871066 RepID=UPI000FE8C091|nr:hypothetical protein [Mesorhizobium sp.]RWK62905.1 MAG: hypothetical protein EOR49_12215 [Mesorhizobium sp.]RWM49783.1 MAG: hypothetical protein EOR76_09670 [Mesorhizobium sp.]RWM55157.1 MAG: hypothetical protein EOR79_21955 [Mesorhizobium sp.]RWM56181.1 MAG: hypothetical protein EOR78_13475 [Mesorhizobium sp.]RWN01834.1 MAG: hypothetical protein EOR85_14115 [Mesorhizobium sp.]